MEAGRLLRGLLRVRVSGSSFPRRSSTEFQKAKPFQDIPSPRNVPVIGNYIAEAWKRQGRAGPSGTLNYFSLKYGSICRVKAFTRYFVIVSDPEALETVMRNEGAIPSRGKRAEKNLGWIHDKNQIPTNLVFAGGQTWKKFRSAMSKQVAPRALHSFTPALYSVARDLCQHLSYKKDAQGTVANIQKDLQNWALKSVTRLVFDEDIDTLSGKDPLAKKFVSTAVNFVASLNKITTALPIYHLFPTKPYKEYVRGVISIQQLGKQMLAQHYAKLQDAMKSGTVDELEKTGLLNQWLAEGKLSEEEAIAQAFGLLAAGTDTTSNTAVFALLELARHPKVQESLYKEIMDVVGPDRDPTNEQIQKLHLVRACIRETLRLYPATAATTRTLANDCVLLGYQVHSGTSVVTNWQLSSVDPRYFSDPLEFKPTRWIEESKTINPFASIPFGFGPRNCYGRRIAELELYLLLTCILQHFQLSTDQASVKLKKYTVLQPAEPVNINISDR